MTSIAIWNIRGLNCPGKQKAMREAIAQYKLAMFGVIETKVKEGKLKKLLSSSGIYTKALSNHEFQYNGRVLLLWNEDMLDVQLFAMSSQFIHVLVSQRYPSYASRFMLSIHRGKNRIMAGYYYPLWTDFSPMGIRWGFQHNYALWEKNNMRRGCCR